jgi:hypothetical protein
MASDGPSVSQISAVSRRGKPAETNRLFAIVSTQSTAQDRPEAESVNPSSEDQLILLN